MMDLYTNRLSKNDFIKDGIIEHVEEDMVVFRNLCHFSKIQKTGMTHDPTIRLQQSA